VEQASSNFIKEFAQVPIVVAFGIASEMHIPKMPSTLAVLVQVGGDVAR
jgi:tryptophan synthase alpha subunit